MLKIKELAAVLVLTSSAPAFAADTCQTPKTPQMPSNGAVITYDDLMASADQVSSFVKANSAYKTCLDAIITHPGEYSRVEWRAALTAYNSAAPAEASVWEAYQKLSDDWVAANQAK